MKTIITLAILCVVCLCGSSQLRAADADQSKTIEVTIDAAQGRRPISPYLFGKNGASELTPRFVADVGLRIARDSAGNNCTKYNWREDLSSHPDWYNNVYKQHLPERAAKLSTQYGDLQVLYGLQVLGWVAKAGGDKVNFSKNDGKPGPIVPDPHTPLCGDGKPDLYLQPWTPKDTVDMLDHFFNPLPVPEDVLIPGRVPKIDGLALDPKHFHYWHLDNEPECWCGTHKDVCPKPMTAEECVQKYVAVAKELRRRYPGVKIMAPGFTAEWFWWNWSDHKSIAGLPWAQYFVKRMAEESKKAGVKLIDVVDFHTYMGPGTADTAAGDEDLLHEYRVFYDPTYQFPRANGCKAFPEAKHPDPKVERIFGRMEEWLNEYFGPGHNITLGVTECMPGNHPPMVLALWYAAMLGTYADHGVEVFTPWSWNEPSWEVMHLFSRYGGTVRIQAISSDDPTVSAFASMSERGDALTVIFLNRDKAPRKTNVSVAGFTPKSGEQPTFTLSDLAAGKTFVSHEQNALKKGTVTVNGAAFSIDLPPSAIVAVMLAK